MINKPIKHEVIFDDEVKEIPQLSEEPINKETGETNPNFIYDDDLQTETQSPKQEKPIKLNKNGKQEKKEFIQKNKNKR